MVLVPGHSAVPLCAAALAPAAVETPLSVSCGAWLGHLLNFKELFSLRFLERERLAEPLGWCEARVPSGGDSLKAAVPAPKSPNAELPSAVGARLALLIRMQSAVGGRAGPERRELCDPRLWGQDVVSR